MQTQHATRLNSDYGTHGQTYKSHYPKFKQRKMLERARKKSRISALRATFYITAFVIGFIATGIADHIALTNHIIH